MSSHTEAAPRAMCSATTKAGAPCRKQAESDGLCLFHSGKLDLAELGRRGGKARRKKEERGGDKLEAHALAQLEDLMISGSATARVQAVKFALDRLTANSPAGLEVAKRALWLDQQALQQQELPRAREKLARLIESCAKELADAMTAEQSAELVEQRSQEKAEQLYAGRMRVETEAVKAEMTEAPAADDVPAGQVDLEELIREEDRHQQRDARERGKPEP